MQWGKNPPAVAEVTGEDQIWSPPGSELKDLKYVQTVAQIQSLALELWYASGVAIKLKTNKQTNKKHT